MSIRPICRVACMLVLAPLALGLASCSKGGDDGASGKNATIAKVSPPPGKRWADMVTKTPEGGYRMGNPAAAIKLVEYGSLTCSHCAEFAEKSAVELPGTFVASGRVSYEFRNFVRDGLDVTAAMLTQCGPPESFFPLTEQAFKSLPSVTEAAFTQAMSQPDDKRGFAMAQTMGLADVMTKRGIAKDKINACLADSAKAQMLAKNTQDQSEQYKIDGTPTFLINGASIGTMGWEELRSKLQDLGVR
jgi:protein-disulfide isomerase